ncbi:MAG TPA: hypothetical protein VH374_19720 [Polyangia bacterium]|jgi:hypothetical protein|nr:hypothetical protein [Polyangia bacterium]
MKITPRRRGYGFAVLFGLGLLCSLPALTAGFYADDYVQLTKLESPTPLSARLSSLFTFSPGGAATSDLIASGQLPWWTSPQFQVRFFRPLSAALMIADHALFGLRPLGYHLHNLLWWLLWLAGTALLFRRVLSPPLALLAFAVFAVDDAHWLPIGWIAARNATVAMTCVVWGLLGYLRYREEDWRPGIVLAVGAWALGLLAGEAAVSGLMYVVAYELTAGGSGRDGSLWRRVRSLVPVGILLIGYAALYRLTGSGVRGSGAYIDPVRDGAAFLGAAAQRVPAQFGALVFGAPLDLWLLPPLQPILIAIGVVAVVATMPWFRATARALPAPDQRGARWLAWGAALGLLPTSAGLLGERSIAAASVGGAVLVAALLRQTKAWQRASRSIAAPDDKSLRSRRLRRVGLFIGLWALALPNLVLAAPWLVTKLLFMRWNGHLVEHVAETAVAGAGPARRTVLLWSDDAFVGSYTPIVARLGHPDALPSFRVMAMAPVDLEITRVAPDTLELGCVGAPLLASEWERLFRTPAQPLVAGMTLPLDGVTVRVVADVGGRPSRVQFRFVVPLDDPSLRFLEWRGRRLVSAELPPLGQTRRLYRSPPLIAADDHNRLLNHGQ